MEIRKRKDGSIAYRAKVYIDHIPVTKTLDRKTDAKAWEAHMRREKRLGQLDLNKFEDLRLYKFAFDSWFETNIKSKSAKTQSDYKSIGNKYLLPLYGSLLLKNIKEEDGDKLTKKLIADGLAAKTSNKIIIVAKQVLKFCERRRWIKENPFRFMETLKESEGRLDFLTDDEIQSLLDSNIGNECYSIFFTALNTGMRIGEVCGLWWDRVDFDRNEIEVSRSLSRKKIQEKTKTGLIRRIPMNGPMRTMLRELYQKRTFSPYVFVRENGSHFTGDHFNKRYFAPALARANVRNATFHVLRHTYASHFMMNRGSIYDLQKVLGHTSITMTQKYAHLSPDHLKKAAEVVQFESYRPKIAPGVDTESNSSMI